jgi:hypothetical protein
LIYTSGDATYKKTAVARLEQFFEDDFINPPLDYERYSELVGLMRMENDQFDNPLAPGYSRHEPRLYSILEWFKVSQMAWNKNAASLFTNNTREDSSYATITKGDAEIKFVIPSRMIPEAGWPALIDLVREDLPSWEVLVNPDSVSLMDTVMLGNPRTRGYTVRKKAILAGKEVFSIESAAKFPAQEYQDFKSPPLN